MIIDRVTGVCRKRHECIEVREARALHPRFTTDPVGVSLTQQADKDQTDINDIVRRYRRTGQLPPGNEGVYADVSGFNGDLTELHQKASSDIQKAEAFRRSYKERAKDKEPAATPPAASS